MFSLYRVILRAYIRVYESKFHFRLFSIKQEKISVLRLYSFVHACHSFRSSRRCLHRVLKARWWRCTTGHRTSPVTPGCAPATSVEARGRQPTATNAVSSSVNCVSKAGRWALAGCSVVFQQWTHLVVKQLLAARLLLSVKALLKSHMQISVYLMQDF